jgi:hypothetical protein
MDSLFPMYFLTFPEAAARRAVCEFQNIVPALPSAVKDTDFRAGRGIGACAGFARML